MNRMTLRIPAFCASVLLTPVHAWTDITIVGTQGNTITPIDETEISMEYEEVRMVPGKVGRRFETTCLFLMKCHGTEAERRTVGFPVVLPLGDSYRMGAFAVSVDGVPQKTRFEEGDPGVKWRPMSPYWLDTATFRYVGFHCWEMVWEPGQTRRIECSYTAGFARETWGLGHALRLLYIVRTGARWKGPIREADVSIELPDYLEKLQEAENRENFLARTSYPDQAQSPSPKQIQWHFENWEPKEDIVVEFLSWIGCDEYYFTRFSLPQEYRGTDERYTDSTLDELVEREITPWEDAFPQRIRELDKQKLRSRIADVLYHEILARGGFHFLAQEKGELSSQDGIGLSTWSDGTVTSRWFSYFQGYGLHGGWYRPDRTKTREEVASELNDIEKANLVFLKGCGARE
jgi:hypothetical protein